MNTATTVKPTPTREELLCSCQKIAKHPNILDLFITELNRAGFAGEERASRLIFLALVSRLFEDPVSIAVKGPSSAGKSHTADQVLKFFPSESYYALSAMSEKALVYSAESLKHRFLVVFEAKGISGTMASYFIRSLLSEGRINYETVVNGPNGWEPKSLYREGPTGLLTTTTLVSLHPDNETRLLSVSVNDSPEQTRRIMEARAASVSGIDEQAATEIDYAPWCAFQQWLALGETKVVVPFAGRLAKAMYAGSVRLRRDFQKLLSLIQAHALIQQVTRPRQGGVILATVNDYVAVRGLISDLIAEAAEQSVSSSIRETVAAVKTLSPIYSDGVSMTLLAKKLNIDKSSATRRVKDAIEKGYLRNEETRPGLPAKIFLGDPLPEEQEVLPQPEALAA